MLINNHANNGKNKGCFYLEDIFGFSKSFKKVTKKLGIQLVLKTADLQDIICTSMTDYINVTNNNLYLYLPIFFSICWNSTNVPGSYSEYL